VGIRRTTDRTRTEKSRALSIVDCRCKGDGELHGCGGRSSGPRRPILQYAILQSESEISEDEPDPHARLQAAGVDRDGPSLGRQIHLGLRVADEHADAERASEPDDQVGAPLNPVTLSLGALVSGGPNVAVSYGYDSFQPTDVTSVCRTVMNDGPAERITSTRDPAGTNARTWALIVVSSRLALTLPSISRARRRRTDAGPSPTPWRATSPGTTRTRRRHRAPSTGERPDALVERPALHRVVDVRAPRVGVLGQR